MADRNIFLRRTDRAVAAQITNVHKSEALSPSSCASRLGACQHETRKNRNGEVSVDHVKKLFAGSAFSVLIDVGCADYDKNEHNILET